jgi:hypothetical protein
MNSLVKRPKLKKIDMRFDLKRDGMGWYGLD